MRLMVLAVIVFTARDGAAQSVLPGPAQPGLLERRFEPPELPRSGGGEIATPEKESALAPPGAEQVTFAFNGVEVEGATVFQGADIRPLYQALLGTTVPVKTVYDIAQAITTKYTAAGYFLSQAVVPPQKISRDGIVRIKMIEGFVDRVLIRGDIQGPRRLLEDYGNSIRAARPLELAVLERYLLLAGDLPGVTVSGILMPSETTPGAADLVFEVTQKNADVSASLDNRGSKYVGPWQASAVTNLNSALGRYERTSLQVATTPFDVGELKYGRLGYEEGVGGEGTKISGDAGYSDSHPGWTLKPEALRAHYLTFGLGLSTPIIRSRAENLTFRSRVESKDSVTDQYEDQRLSEDRLRIVRAGGSYDWVDTLLATPAVSLAAIELSQGFDGLGARPFGAPNSSRATGRSAFFKATLDASRSQRLTPEAGLSIGLSGQWARSSLLASEEFAFGGAQFGRGYDPAEIVGDHGLAGKAELQYAGPTVPVVKDWQLYGFYDIGRVWQVRPLTGERRTDGGASTGFGLRSCLNDVLWDLPNLPNR